MERIKYKFRTERNAQEHYLRLNRVFKSIEELEAKLTSMRFEFTPLYRGRGRIRINNEQEKFEVIPIIEGKEVDFNLIYRSVMRSPKWCYKDNKKALLYHCHELKMYLSYEWYVNDREVIALQKEYFNFIKYRSKLRPCEEHQDTNKVVLHTENVVKKDHTFNVYESLK